MITSKSDIQTGGSGVEREAFFRINQDNISHILGILRNSMYSDKILAVCREYMCNAFDAHVASGIGDRPISVQTPSRLYPFFTVRDFGKGLDEEQVFGLFTSYGDSTKRESNEYVGMLGIGCLLKGQPIVTLDGMKPIDEIVEGDMVLTHKGRYRRVTGIMQRHHKGPAYEVHLSQGSKPLILTDEHPMLVSDYEGNTRWVAPKHVEDGYKKKTKGIAHWKSYAVLPKTIESLSNTIKVKDYLPDEFEFVNGVLHQSITMNYQRSDWKQRTDSRRTHVYPNVPEYIELTEEIGWLFGLWAAEGCAGHKQLNVTLNQEEVEISARFQDGFFKLFGLTFATQDRKDRHSLELTTNCVPVAAFLQRLMGKHAGNKHVPKCIFNASQEVRNGFLQGVFDGDGSSTRTRFTFGVASPKLCWGVRTLQATQGYWKSVGYLEYPTINGFLSKRWSVERNPEVSHNYYLTRGDYLLRPIKEMRPIEIDTTVYNIDVEEDNSYVSDFILHNSKAAFSYTDSFNVVGYHEGRKKTYTCYIDETEVGKVALLSDEPMDAEDETGLEINIPVKSADNQMYVDKAKALAQMFSVRPMVDGQEVHALELVEGNDFENSWFLVSRKHNPTASAYLINNTNQITPILSAGSLYILMGNICYPIPWDRVPNHFSYLTRYIQGRHHALVMRVDIGQVDIAASREALSFTQHTLATLNECCERFILSIKESLAEIVCAQPTELAAYVKVTQLESASLGTYQFQLRWRPNTTPIQSAQYKPSTFQVYNYRTIPIPVGVEALEYVQVHGYRRSTLKYYPYKSSTIDVLKLPVLVNDLGKKNCGAHLRRALIEHHLTNALFCREPKDLNAMKRELEGYIYMLSDYPAPEAEIAQKKYNSRFSVKQHEFLFNPQSENLWEDVEVDLDNSTGYYVPIYRFIPVLQNKHHQWPSWLKTVSGTLPSLTTKTGLELVMNMARAAGIDVSIVYGVRTNKTSPMQSHPNWMNLFTELERVWPAYCAQHKSYLGLCSKVHHFTVFQTPYMSLASLQDALRKAKSEELRGLAMFIASQDLVWIDFAWAICQLLDVAVDIRKSSITYRCIMELPKRIGLGNKSLQWITSNWDIVDLLLQYRHEHGQDLCASAYNHQLLQALQPSFELEFN